jgi:hypothetical protein
MSAINSIGTRIAVNPEIPPSLVIVVVPQSE